MTTNSVSHPCILRLMDRQSQKHRASNRLTAKSRHYPRFTVPPLTEQEYERNRAIADSVLARVFEG